jgi:tetratricopeptide (TPR) repeat protein
VLNNLGKFHMDRGDLARARPVLRQAIARRRRLYDLDGVADTLNNLGIVEIMSGRLPRSRRLLEIGLRLRRRAGDRFGEVLALANLAEVDLLSGNYAAAERGFADALRFMQEAGHHRLCRGLKNSQTAVWLTTGRARKAERLSGQVAEEAAAAGDRLQEGIARCRLAEAAMEHYRQRPERGRGLLMRARDQLSQAGAIFEKLPHRYQLAIAILRLVELRQIAAAGGEQLPADAGREALLTEIIADLASHSLKTWHALTRGSELLRAQRPEREAAHPPPSAGIPPESLEKVRALFDDARVTAQRFGLREALWQAHLGTGRAWRLAGRFRRAHNHLEQAVEVLSDLQAALPTAALRRGLLRSGGRAAVQEEVTDLARAAGLVP